MRDTAKSTALDALTFASLAAIALAIVVLVAGSIFVDYYPWQIFGWLTLGLVIAWVLILMPVSFAVNGYCKSLVARADWLQRERRDQGDRRLEYLVNLQKERRLADERMLEYLRLRGDKLGLEHERSLQQERRRLSERKFEQESRLQEHRSRGAAFIADYGRAENHRLEIFLIGCLIILSGAAYLVSYLSTRTVLDSMQQSRFNPAETAQVITAIGGLGLAVGTSIAAIIKSYALLLRARADVIRARSSLEPGELSIKDEESDLSY